MTKLWKKGMVISLFVQKALEKKDIIYINILHFPVYEDIGAARVTLSTSVFQI